MSEARESESGPVAFIWIWALALIPLTYFLSIGPALLTFKNTPNPQTRSSPGYHMAGLRP